MLKKIKIRDLVVLYLSKKLAGLFVWSTRFGKQTYAKRAIQAVWKASK